MTMIDHIKISLGSNDHVDAHRLYHAGLELVALGGIFSPAVLRAVADKLEDQGYGASPHEAALFSAMAKYLRAEAE